MKPQHLLILAAALCLPHSAYSQQSPAPPSTAPVAATTAPATQPKTGLIFDFRDAPIETVLDALAENYGLTIIRGSTPIPGRITIISRGKDQPLTAAQAVEITNSLLLPLGYGLVETSLSPESAPTYRIQSINEIKKAAPLGVPQEP